MFSTIAGEYWRNMDTDPYFISATEYTKSVSLSEAKTNESKILTPKATDIKRIFPNVTIESLPFELRLKIANQLSQIDCLNLMLTSKLLYMSTISRLYQHIIVDEGYSQFTKEYKYLFYEGVSCSNDKREFSCTYINNSYSLKKFIKTYTILHQQISENYHKYHSFEPTFPYIKMLTCVKLPDSFHLADHDLYLNMLDFFKSLDHLKDLTWWTEEIPFEFLEAIPNKSNVISLKLNLKLNKFLDRYSSFDKVHHLDCTSDYSKVLDFPNLEGFLFKPFESSKCLLTIIDNILVGKSGGNSVGTRLKRLEISRFDSERALLVPPCYDLVTENITNDLDELDKDIISAAFSKSKLNYLQNLAELLLDNCLVTVSDYEILKKSIDLSRLITLKLRNISEYRIVDNAAEIAQSAIISIAPCLQSLENLHLDIREAVVDSIPLFLKELSTTNLKSLDLIMRYNDTKLHTYSGIEQFIDAYAEAVTSGNKDHTLKHISVEVIQENPFSDMNIPIISERFLKEISLCKQLISLRLNTSNTNNGLFNLVSSLPQLRFLHVLGQKTVGSPDIGIGMLNPSVFDEWFQVQETAALCLKANKLLNYIRINDCIFEISSQFQLMPRNGLINWFDKIIRV